MVKFDKNFRNYIMRKRELLIPAVLLIMFLAGSCSSLTVTSDYDKSVDFTKYKTYSYYGWADNSDKILTPFDKERIEKSFANEFSKRGLTFQKEGGDLTVSLYIVTQQKKETTATTTGIGYRGYGGYWGYGPGWGWGTGIATTSYNTYNYTVGTLVCDVFDAKAKKLIWEGVGQGTVDDNPQTRENNIPKAVAKIMLQYPIAPSSGN